MDREKIYKKCMKWQCFLQEDYQNEVKRLRQEQNRLYADFKKDVLEYIEEEMEHPVTEWQKELIYSTAYEHGHSSSYEFFNKVDVICEFCDSFMDKKEEL